MSKEKIKEALPDVTVIRWPQTKNKDGLYPLKIRVIYNRKPWYKTVQFEGKKLFLTKEYGDLIVGQQDPKKIKDSRGKKDRLGEEIRKRINQLISDAETVSKNIMSQGAEFTFAKFEKDFIDKKVSGGVFYWFEKYLDELKREQRIGTYASYNNSLQALKRFKKNKDFSPGEITYQFLRDFERFLLDGKKGKGDIKDNPGVSETTVAIYMRGLKVIYNYIADDHPNLRENYPFSAKQNDRRRYRIGSTDSKKGEALTPEQLQKFITIDTLPGFPDHEAKQYFLFSLECQGMNLRDIAYLKYSNIQGNVLRYTRKKTKATTKNGRVIEVPLSDEAQSIIVDLGNQNKAPDAYVFPILSPGLDAFKVNAVVKQKTKVINKWLKRLCEANDLPPVTTYWARHTYASLMKFSGAPIGLIREALGHGDIKTTEAYLKRFDVDTKRAANEKMKAYMKKAV